jgi:hypothetical protein
VEGREEEGIKQRKTCGLVIIEEPIGVSRRFTER